jgi:uncharacterized protein
MSFNISPDLAPLPAAAVTQKFACLGISGSGKTYGAGKFTETLLDAGAQVVVVDTIGNWGQGLRLAADGKKPGIPVPILGGEHGDVPLDGDHGELAAQTVVETLSPLVLDVSDFTKGELCGFVTDFATELLKLKKRQKSPLMVVWEECQDIVPQVVRGEKARMVGAVEALIKKGRNYGVGTLLISQRAAAVNKDVLNQIETLFAFRQNSKHDRLAVRDWVVSQAIDVTDLAEQLPTLKTGECFCWSPSWLGVLKKIKFGKKRTFDASRTPDATDYVKPGVLAPVNLEAFKASMTEALERVKADDPKALRARIAELEQQLTTEQGAHDMTKVAFEAFVDSSPEVEPEPLLTEAQISRIERAAEALQRHGIEAVEAARDIIGALPQRELLGAGRVGERAPISAHAPPVTKPKPAEHPPISTATSAHSRPVTNGAGAGLGKCARAILTAIVQHGRPSLTLVQAAIIAGYASDSGGVRNAAGELRSGGFVAGSNDALEPLPAGRGAVADVPKLPRGKALAELWYAKLGKAESFILKHVVDRFPKPVALVDAAEACGYAPDSGGVRNAAGKLRTLMLVHGANAAMVADERLVR